MINSGKHLDVFRFEGFSHSARQRKQVGLGRISSVPGVNNTIEGWEENESDTDLIIGMRTDRDLQERVENSTEHQSLWRRWFDLCSMLSLLNMNIKRTCLPDPPARSCASLSLCAWRSLICVLMTWRANQTNAQRWLDSVYCFV